MPRRRRIPLTDIPSETGNSDGVTSQQEPTPVQETSINPDREYTITDGGEKESAVDRVVVPINKDGSIAWDSIRQSRRGKIRESLSSTKIREDLFGKDPASLVGDSEARIALDAVNNLEKFLAIRGGCAPDIVDSIFPFSKEEYDILCPPTIRLMNKYLPSSVTQMKDEIVLAMLLIQTGYMKFKMCQMATQQRAIQQQQQEEGSGQ